MKTKGTTKYYILSQFLKIKGMERLPLKCCIRAYVILFYSEIFIDVWFLYEKGISIKSWRLYARCLIFVLIHLQTCCVIPTIRAMFSVSLACIVVVACEKCRGRSYVHFLKMYKPQIICTNFMFCDSLYNFLFFWLSSFVGMAWSDFAFL